MSYAIGITDQPTGDRAQFSIPPRTGRARRRNPTPGQPDPDSAPKRAKRDAR